MAPTDPSMFPELPADLGQLSEDELTTLLTEFREVAALVAASDEETLGARTAEAILAETEAAAAAIDAITTEQKTRADEAAEYQARIAEFATRAGVTAEAGPEDEEPEADGDDTEGDGGDETPAEPEAVEDPALVTASAKQVRRPLPRTSRTRPQANQLPEGTPVVASTMAYPSAEPGEHLTSRRLAEVKTDMINKSRIAPGQSVVLASATFEYPEERILYSNGPQNSRKIAAVQSPQALVASGGLCAPLTPIYTLPSFETADRPVRDALAGFRADRGGVIVPEDPIITDYEDAVGSVTAEDDALGGTFAVKNCMRIECPSFNSVEVDSIYRCIEVGNLTGRAYPELLERIDTLVLANWARLAESKLLGQIRTGSVAVTDVNTTSTAGAVWKLLGYLHASVAGMKSRNRMSDNARIRGLFPRWLIEAIQVDLGRAAFTRADAEADARALFARCGVTATFYDDTPIDDDGNILGTSQLFAPQTAGNLLPFPTAVQYGLYPEGSWLHLDSGSLDLGIVRDSTLNSTNDYQQFAESWEKAALIGIDSQWHTATLSFNGTFSASKDFSAATSF